MILPYEIKFEMPLKTTIDVNKIIDNNYYEFQQIWTNLMFKFVYDGLVLGLKHSLLLPQLPLKMMLS